MFDKKEFKNAAAHHKALSVTRRELQGVATLILGASKRCIFATQRADKIVSEKELGVAKASIKKGKALVKREWRLTGEGAWRAALEEYTEASMYHDAIFASRIAEPKEIGEDPDTFIGALSDLTGELTRTCVLAATKRKFKEVERLQELVTTAVEFLLGLDLTGAQRQKFDQAKQNLRKIEEIAFSLSLHVKK